MPLVYKMNAVKLSSVKKRMLSIRYNFYVSEYNPLNNDRLQVGIYSSIQEVLHFNTRGATDHDQALAYVQGDNAM